ncbi:permease-like cell division protein FtsX [Salinisphaera hydrothermalis]|uniref:Cell division protein FtsX n=1 Tax=Salinisphaera hydrothermalis (strain C41B8) TaxID=1304275 RepID=A0A084IR69_SALHC|nr:permease-like cell division protein FtsX [Salinisphaera hydrothermalis]KEZ79203.1 cell division protein [Salinisphaera hydrothermalis C41B8]
MPEPQSSGSSRSAGPASRGSGRGRLAAWAASHARCLLESLGRLHRRWVASLLTVLVIGIALALPAGLYVLVKNLDTLASSWHQSVRISLYLKQDVSADSGQRLADDLAGENGISSTQFISADEGLRQFKQASSFGAALDALGSNPLPGVIEVTPKASLPPAAVGQLVDQLSKRRQVDHAALDQAWLRRLTAILALISRASWVIGALLSAAVLFIVGNTIRLDIENRRQEIEVMKLLGAGDAFIRRPFLYSGVWYGLLGAIVAIMVLVACYMALGGPLSTLTASYQGGLSLTGLSLRESAGLLAIGIALGWAGCAITVNRQLAAIEPR